MAEKARPQCFFEVEINREPIGRIVFQLFSDVCPKTCTNFLCLCTGEKGIGKVTGKKLWYKGSTFHRVVKSFMIQGGDFSEGNGKGGESVFGGYFKDENFMLKHDRAFLLSMANRGKHTNGSQFFITTRPAPHLDGVHVVFGLVISGFEVIEQIENLKTDAASRPYADVRVIDCGILGSKSTKDGKVKAATSAPAESNSSSKSSSPSSSSESSSSESEAEVEKNKKRKRKRKTKVKHAKRRRKEGRREVKEEKPQSHHSAHSEKNGTAEDKDSGTKRDKPVVRPEEIPPIPENRFLLRKDAPMNNPELEQKASPVIPEMNEQAKGCITKSGRKIRGRGTIRYHTPPRSRSRSESSGERESSETPPHWKEEMQRLKSYKPPTGEKWSKGDKLNERLPSRWDEGSPSPRSRSNSWSHDSYHSNSSRERTSRSKTRKKDKKIKHKKKSKKVKHSKKHKKKEEFSGSHQEESSSRRRKYSQERIERSTSKSSRDSSKKGWSRSDKEQKSSRHSSNSQSRSRSYSRASGKSRTSSKSSSRSRSRTKSRSRNRNVSRSHSNSHSSKHTKASSASPRKKHLAGSKSGKGVLPAKSAVNSSGKSADESLLAFVTNENIHVISLSDSPPPSRWKPGQKPWKPSYERIQEMKASASNVLSTQSRYGPSKVKNDSYRKRHSSSESERSDYSGRSSSYHHKSNDRSSSRSYSRSYTRSRSQGSSSSHAEKVVTSSYNSSSSSRSSDEIVHSEASSSKKTKSKIKNRPCEEKVKMENSVSPKSMGSHSNSDSSSSDTEGEEFTKRLLKTTKALLVNHNSNSSKEEINNSVEESNTDCHISKSDKDGTPVVVSNPDNILESDELKETVEKVIDEDSISNSQNVNVTEEVASSGKEEGEASSESETEEVKPSKTPPLEASPPVSEKLSKTPPSESLSPEHKSKSKKHKRRSSKKSVKKSHSKNKGKDKSKRNKEKKQKAQKKKQTFHWQPPLEFGEEEEDEEIAGGKPDMQMKANNPKDLLVEKPSATESRKATNGSLLIDKIITEPKIVSLTSAVKTEDVEPLSKVTKSPHKPATVEPTSDDIKGFTSHRSLPQIKLGTTSTGGISGGASSGNSDQKSSPSANTASPPVESVQVKEEKTQDVQSVSNSATSVEKLEAGPSEIAFVDNKWKPVQGPTIVQPLKPTAMPAVTQAEPEKKTQGLRIEIKSKNKVRPGSLFDEVRKTARLNQRPRNQESSSEERSSSHEDKSQSSSKAKSRSKSQTPSSHQSRSRSSSRSRSRSLRSSSSSRSRSYTRSRSRRRPYRSRTRSRSYSSYKSYRTYSRSRSRSVSYDRHRRRSRSRSHTYDSYDSRSRSRSPMYYRSRSYNRRSRSRRSSYSGSDRSYSHRRRHSGRS